VGAGYHYLNDYSPYRNIGTTNINSALAADLQRRTTDAPLLWANSTIAQSTTLLPQAQWDTDAPDLGFHH
jgi:hypothetical protein